MPSDNQNQASAEKAEGKRSTGTVKRATSKLENPLLGVTALLERYGYQLGEILGKGSYAVVRKANSKRHKKIVAIKIICKKKAPDDFLTKFLPREIKILKKIRHAHVIPLIEVIESNTRMYIITEIAENGDLLEYIRRNGAIPEAKARDMFRQLIAGVYYIHKLDIVHRDLKCENLLLGKDLNLIISDFGFARDNLTTATGKRKLSHTYCGSYAYAPPEILKGKELSCRCYCGEHAVIQSRRTSANKTSRRRQSEFSNKQPPRALVVREASYIGASTRYVVGA